MQARADAERARHHAEAARLSIEAGRASNVIACVEWVRGNTDRAISIWRELTADLTKSRATWPQRRLAWRYWSNFAGAQMRGEKSEAVLAASHAVEIILADSAQRLPVTRHAKYREARWCTIWSARASRSKWAKTTPRSGTAQVIDEECAVQVGCRFSAIARDPERVVCSRRRRPPHRTKRMVRFVLFVLDGRSIRAVPSGG